MKKYTKPMVLCEEFHPETICAACLIQNPNYNEYDQCGYEPDGLGFTLFADSWAACDLGPGSINSGVCYHPGTTNLFGS